MWIVWIVALVLIGVGAVLWMHRMDDVARREPPRGGAGIATDGGDEPEPEE